MKVKHLLEKYDGDFYIYKDITDDKPIASHESGAAILKKIKNKKIYTFVAGDFSIDIYL